MPNAGCALEDLIYDSVTDSSQWSNVTDELAKLADATSVLLFDTTRAPEDGGLWVGRNIAAEATREYVDHFGSVDVWIEAATEVGFPRLGNLWTGEQALDERQLYKSEFFNDFLRLYDLGRLCTAVLSVDEASGLPGVWCSLYRPPKADPFSSGQLDSLRRLVPHLSRAVRLRERLASAATGTAAAVGIEGLLDQLAIGVVCLDGGGRVITANENARRIAARRDGLAIRHRALTCDHRTSNDPLASAVGLAISDRRSGTDLAVPRPSGRRPYLLSVIPLSPAGAEHAAGPAVRAVVYVFDPDSAAMSDTGDRLGAFYGLSPAERRVASQILHNLSPAEIAARNGVSLETVRSQIKSLFAKTDTARQSQLVRRLSEAASIPRIDRSHTGNGHDR